jgi:hypothetical protein
MYNTMQENGVLSILKNKINNLEINFQTALEDIILYNIEDEIKDLSFEDKREIWGEVLELSNRLQDDIENNILEL